MRDRLRVSEWVGEMPAGFWGGIVLGIFIAAFFAIAVVYSEPSVPRSPTTTVAPWTPQTIGEPAVMQEVPEP